MGSDKVAVMGSVTTIDSAPKQRDACIDGKKITLPAHKPAHKPRLALPLPVARAASRLLALRIAVAHVLCASRSHVHTRR